MEENYICDRFELAGQMTEEQNNRINLFLGSTDGVDTWRIDDNAIEVEFSPYAVSEEYLRGFLSKMNILADEGIVKKSGKKGLLARLSAANKKNFGSGRLDCCDLTGKG